MTSQPETAAAFPRLDRVIRRQRRMMRIGQLVTFALAIGGLGAATTTLAGCAPAGTPLPAVVE